MTDKRKQRIKKVAEELGIGHRAAANVIAKRVACSRAGHPANREPYGEKCTDCGLPLRSTEPEGASHE